MKDKEKNGEKLLFLSYFSLMKKSKNHTRSVVYEKTKEGERLLLILLFLDEK
jgi:hypothetical protein